MAAPYTGHSREIVLPVLDRQMPPISGKSIRAICFDLDDTLWPLEGVLHAAEAALFDWIAEEFPRLADYYTIDSLRESRIEFARTRPQLQHDLTRLRMRHLQTVFEQHSCPPGRVGDGMAVFLEHRNRVHPFPDVEPALKLLQPHFQLVSLTNGNSAVEQSVIGHFFNQCFTSAGLGVAKPDHKIFNRLAVAIRTPPEQILHVGDDPQNDIDGAMSAGLRAAWINRRGRKWDTRPAADLEIIDLHQLCDVLMSRS